LPALGRHRLRHLGLCGVDVVAGGAHRLLVGQVALLLVVERLGQRRLGVLDRLGVGQGARLLGVLGVVEVTLVLVDRLVVADQLLGVVSHVALVAGPVRPHDAEDVVVVGQVVLDLGVGGGQVVALLLVLLSAVVVLVVVALGRGRGRGRRRPEL